MRDSFKSRTKLSVNGISYDIFQLKALESVSNLNRLPYSLKILLENLLRTEDGNVVRKADIEALLKWDPKAEPNTEIAFTPARVLLQDFTGVPAVVDLAAMRHAMVKLGGNALKINPLSPVDLVIDHSVQVDHFGNSTALGRNTEIEFERNQERYAFLKWGQKSLRDFRVVPPGTGIVHQVNLEYLASVVFVRDEASQDADGNKSSNGVKLAYPDTLVGTDSHTTMINGLGVLGWGVGGIEAEAAMLGQAVTMLIPEVVGFKMTGKLKEGTTATDLVLTVVEMLRKKGVVGKFVEFYGEGLKHLSLADRATIANMAPEYGATCGIFPIDEETLNYLRLSGRDKQQIDLVSAYAKAQGMFHDENTPEAEYSDTLHLDLGNVVPCIAGPKRPQDRINLNQSKAAFLDILKKEAGPDATINTNEQPLSLNQHNLTLKHGDVVIAAITSCTNTSNPAVMLAAGLVAKKAKALGLSQKPWVKTSLAPGSQVVTDYLVKANLLSELESIGFNLVGYGCTTCIGNSGPLMPEISQAITNGKLMSCAVLSGNRNFEGRIHPLVKNAYLASPPLVVVYALAGTMAIDLEKEPLGFDKNGKGVFLKDVWPTQAEINDAVACIDAQMFKSRYEAVFNGDSHWQRIESKASEQFPWDDKSTYIKNPPYFENMSSQISPIEPIQGARCLAYLGDSVTTDHISPAGDIAKNSPAGQYLKSKHVSPEDFNSYGSRRGNHEVMMRGTFANIRLRNQLAPNTEGEWTTFQPTNEQMSIYDASMKYQAQKTPLVILAGKEYGTGSSRDWAAKGTRLLGVKAVIVESFERIHRSNLIGMGVLPLQFKDGESAKSLGLTGKEVFAIDTSALAPQKTVKVTATAEDGQSKQFEVRVRIDTPKELEYYQHGGILHYVLRDISKK